MQVRVIISAFELCFTWVERERFHLEALSFAIEHDYFVPWARTQLLSLLGAELKNSLANFSKTSCERTAVR